MKHFIGSKISKSLSWSQVNLFYENIKLFLGNGIKVGFLGNILTKESVRIFIGSSFPTVIGMSKINGGFREILNHLVVCEFSSVIKGEGFSFVERDFIPKYLHRIGYSKSIFTLFQFVSHQVSRFPFHKSENRSFSVFSDDSISFPISNPQSFVCFIRSLIDHSPFSNLVFPCQFFLLPIAVVFSFSAKIHFHEFRTPFVYEGIYRIF